MSIVKEVMLIQVNGAANANKFYHVTLDDNGIVTKRWGRVGSAGTSSQENTGSYGFDKIVSAKTRRGYEKTDVISDSTPTAQGTSIEKETLRSVAKSSLSAKPGDALLEALIERLVDINKHEIIKASGGVMSIDTSGVIRTPLGLVSLHSIQKAEVLLNQYASTASSAGKEKLVEDYLKLVPQKVGMKRGWAAEFLDDADKLQKQLDFLDQLRSSLTWADGQKKAAVAAQKGADDFDDKYKDLFKVKLNVVTDPKTIKKVEDFYKSSVNSIHSAAKLKLKRVFELEYPAEANVAFGDLSAKLGNERQLWHGTRAHNVLSILRQGLYVPPVTGTTIQIAGRMFGDGVYFSDQSTKSLNYSYGYWSGARESNCFMFLADVVLGNEYRPYQNGGWKGQASLNEAHRGKNAKGRGFDSISIKGGTCGVQNNEIIVWKTDQIRLRYLCEFA